MHLTQYKDRYESLAIERSAGGVLEVRLHTEGGPLQWGLSVHRECAEAFADIARDHENRVVIITGTGDAFSGPPGSPATAPRATAREWESIRHHGMLLTKSLLEIEAVVISAVNGPALRHPEIPLLGDIVLAAEDAVFQDSGHLQSRLTPGDGVHFVFPLLLGPNRGRYFVLTGQAIGAEEAYRLGLVAEVLPRDALIGRARELATTLLDHNPLTLRYARILMTEGLRRTAQDLLGYGLALEGLGAIDEATHRERAD